MERQATLSLNLDNVPADAATLSALQDPIHCTLESLRIQGSSSQIHGHTSFPVVWKDAIIHFLQHSRHLRDVSFWQRSEDRVWPASDFEPFAVGLAHKDCMVSKLAIQCDLDERGCAMLVDMLRSTSCIGELDVTVTDSIYPSVLQGLLVNSSVHSLSLFAEFVGFSWEDQSDLLSDLLNVQHCSLRTLSLFQFSPDCVPELFQAVARNTTLTTLGVLMEMDDEDFLLDDDQATEILRALQVNSTLTDFELEAHVTSRSVGRILLDAVKSTRAQTCLTLRNSTDVIRPTLITLAARFIEECHNLVQLKIYDDTAPCDITDTFNILRAVESNPNLEELRWSWLDDEEEEEEDEDTLVDFVDLLIASLPKFGPRFKKLEFHVERVIDDNNRSKILKALSCNCALESLRLSYPYVFDERLESCLYKNKMRREFLVKTTMTTTTTTESRTNPVAEADTATTTPPSLLPWVLATVSQQPCSASVRYHVLRKNVHAFVGTLLLSSGVEAPAWKRKRTEG